MRALEDTGFPVWARAVPTRGTVKSTLGRVNVLVVCAGQLVHPGDVVVADDGVVVVARSAAPRVLAAGTTDARSSYFDSASEPDRGRNAMSIDYHNHYIIKPESVPATTKTGPGAGAVRVR